MKKIAWLIMQGENAGAKRHKDTSFEGTGNQGAIVVSMDIMKETGEEVLHCVPETAKNFDIVLVSFTSNYDMIAFARAVYQLPEWRKDKRKFIVVGGGFGMQNPYHIQEWIDYAYFGRAENEIGKIIKYNFEYPSDSLMRIRESGLHPIVFRQSNVMLEYDSRVGKKEYVYKEEMHGCPNKCTYCHFTYARKHEGRKDFVVDLTGGKSLELEWMDPCLYVPHKSDIITALDGISERSRFLHNRRLSNEDIEKFFRHVLNNMEVGCTDLNLYNIIGMEAAEKSDWEYFINLVEKLNKEYKGDKKLRIKLTNTPFRASPITPAVWSRINLNYKEEFTEQAYKIIYDMEYSVNYNKDKSVMLFQRSPLESEASLLSDMSVVRGGVQNSEKIFNLFAFNSKFRQLRRGEQYEYLQNKYDLTDLIREYDVNETLPTWFLESYISNDVLKKIRIKAKENLKKTWDSATKRFI